MKGTDLKPLPTGVQWTIGSTAEVTWNVMFNHGGGYSYRLCPADEPLTEECFQKGHLEFVQVRRREEAEMWANLDLYSSSGSVVVVRG